MIMIRIVTGLHTAETEIIRERGADPPEMIDQDHQDTVDIMMIEETMVMMTDEIEVMVIVIDVVMMLDETMVTDVVMEMDMMIDVVMMKDGNMINMITEDIMTEVVMEEDTMTGVVIDLIMTILHDTMIGTSNIVRSDHHSNALYILMKWTPATC